MPDLTLSNTMDAFLAETDSLVSPHGIKDIYDVLSIDTNTRVLYDYMGNVVMEWAGANLPVYYPFGIVMNDDKAVNFANGSRVQEGLTDAGNGGAGGVALVCSIDYELKWEAGRLYVMQQDGFTIRVEQFGFTDIPDTSDDNTKGYIIGSRRILDDGTIYICADATTGSAIWNIDQASLAFLNRQLVDSGNIISANWGYRQLYGSDGIPCAGWNSSGFNFGWDGSFDFYHTLDANGINTPAGLVVDIGYKQLKSSVGTSLDWENRQLIANDGTTVMLDWSNSTAGVALTNGMPLGVDLIFDAGIPLNYIDMVNGEIGGYSGSYTPSIDWINRQLIASDGTTVVADWANCYLSDNTSITSIHWSYRELYDSSVNLALNWANRQLIGSDGVKIAVDWSSGIPVTPSATLSPTAVASLVGNQGTIAYVDDASTPVTHGQPITGGGAEKALVCFNGTDWITVSHLS